MVRTIRVSPHSSGFQGIKNKIVRILYFFFPNSTMLAMNTEKPIANAATIYAFGRDVTSDEGSRASLIMYTCS